MADLLPPPLRLFELELPPAFLPFSGIDTTTRDFDLDLLIPEDTPEVPPDDDDFLRFDELREAFELRLLELRPLFEDFLPDDDAMRTSSEWDPSIVSSIFGARLLLDSYKVTAHDIRIFDLISLQCPK